MMEISKKEKQQEGLIEEEKALRKWTTLKKEIMELKKIVILLIALSAMNIIPYFEKLAHNSNLIFLVRIQDAMVDFISFFTPGLSFLAIVTLLVWSLFKFKEINEFERNGK